MSIMDNTRNGWTVVRITWSMVSAATVSIDGVLLPTELMVGAALPAVALTKKLHYMALCVAMSMKS
jgi:hypothetical protein